MRFKLNQMGINAYSIWFPLKMTPLLTRCELGFFQYMEWNHLDMSVESFGYMSLVFGTIRNWIVY